METNKPRIRLIFDFDGTMTVSDTTAVIGSHVLARASEMTPSGTSEDQLPKPMDYYSQQYMQDYQSWKQTCQWPHGERKTVAEEVAYLSTAKEVERNSFLRVRSAALSTPGTILELHHGEELRNEFMMRAGSQAVRQGDVQIRESQVLKHLIAMADETSLAWGVVSVSWSRRFIIGALREAGLIRPGDQELLADRVICNELLAPLEYDEDGCVEIICTAQDKVDALHRLLAHKAFVDSAASRIGKPIGSNGGRDEITIYIGDSMTDIGCLTGPALGMYLKDWQENDSVKETISKLNVQWLEIEDLPAVDAIQKLTDLLQNLQQREVPLVPLCSIKSLAQLRDWLVNVT